MSRVGLVLVAMLICAATVCADDELILERLVEWQEDPLDLLIADPADLALLPGMDPERAAALVRLRSAGELVGLDDLRRIRGLDAVQIETLRPYVRIGDPYRSQNLGWNFVGQEREPGPRRWVQRWNAGGDGFGAQFLTAGQEGRLRRGGVWVNTAAVRWTLGEFVLDTPTGILDPRAGRSRLAAAPAPADARLRLRTDGSELPGWLGGAVQGRGWAVFVARTSDEDVYSGVALNTSSEFLHAGAEIRVGKGAPAFGGWAVHQTGNARSWTQWMVESTTRSAALGSKIAGERWSVGTDASLTDGPLTMGSDALTGHRLDRPHQVWQSHARRRGHGWALGGIWRELWRGADAEPVRTVEFEGYVDPSAADGVRRLELRARVSPSRRFTVRALLDAGPGELRISYSRESDPDGPAEITGGSWVLAGRHAEFRLGAAWADGSGTRVWMVSRPGTGAYPVWLQPGTILATLGARWRVGARSLGGWIWVPATETGVAAPGFGVSIQVEARELVRRLQVRTLDRVLPARPGDLPARTEPDR